MLPNFLFLPSLPIVNEYFNSNFSIFQFSISAYLFTSASLQIILGPLADFFGKRKVLSICFIIFIFSTLLCLTTENVYLFLLYRMFQATAVSGMVISRAIAADINNDEKQLKKIMANMAIIMALITVFAPFLGGVLLNVGSWRLIFYVLLIIAIILLSYNHFFYLEKKSISLNFKRHLHEYKILLLNPYFWIYSLVGGSSTITFFSLMIAIPFMVENIYFISITTSSLMLSFITSGFIIGNISSTKFLGSMNFIPLTFYSLLIGIIGVILSFLLYISVNNIVIILIPFFLSGLSTGIIWPMTTSKILMINEKMRASSSGLNGAIFLGFGAIASSSTGILLSITNSIFSIYIIAILSLLIMSILFIFLRLKPNI